MPETFPVATPLRRRVLSSVVTIALALAGVVAFAPPAHAAVYGPSYDIGNGHLGAYSVGGVHVYCLEIEKARPLGATSGAVYQGWGSLSALDLARINMAVSTFGQSQDRRMTAAVDLYVWSIADAAEYNSHGMSGDSWFITRATAADIPTIRANLATIRAAAAATAVGSNGTGTATLSIQMFDSYDGQVTVAVSPASATGTLHLDGATIAGTPADTAPVTDGSVIAIRGTPLDSQTEEYAITASATFTVTNSGGYLGQIAVFTTGAAQRLAGPGGQAPASYSFDASDYVTDPLELQFEPIITTQVSDAIVQPGEAFVDQLTVALSPDSPSDEWRSFTDGPVPVLAVGALYGPFPEAPLLATSAPSDAPLAWTETLALTGMGTISSSGAFTAAQSGYYTWVWRINWVDQDSFTQAALTRDYQWLDAFGQVAETAVAAISVGATTRVSDEAVGLWQPVSDTLEVTHDASTGPWWTTAGGTAIGAHFRGSAYWIAGDVAPAVTPNPPPDAILIGQRDFGSITGPGTYTAPSVTAPQHENGFIVWQWELVGDDTGAFVPWRDEFALPAETTRVTPPTLTTTATAIVPATGEAVDSAIIGGEPTGASTYLSFAIFRQNDPDVPVCDATSLVDDSVDEPIEVVGPGTYNSAPVTLDETGTYFWVATLRTSEGRIIEVGNCGDPGEHTEVVPFVVATEAVETVAPGGVAHDTATIVGPTPAGATITFAAYLHDATRGEPDCQHDNRVFSTGAVPVQLNGPGIYASAEHKFQGAGTYLWVETVWARTGEILHIGACGSPYEITEVQAPTLAFTGPLSSLTTSIGLAAILVGILILVASTRRRRFRYLQP